MFLMYEKAMNDWEIAIEEIKDDESFKKLTLEKFVAIMLYAYPSMKFNDFNSFATTINTYMDKDVQLNLGFTLVENFKDKHVVVAFSTFENQEEFDKYVESTKIDPRNVI